MIAGQGTRPGTAKKVAGGLSLSGSWSFGSGLKHSSHVHSLGIIEETGEPRIFVTPIEAVEPHRQLGRDRPVRNRKHRLHDGLRLRAGRMEPLRRHHRAGARRRRLYGIGIIGFAVTCHSGWAMGVGRRMLDELAGLVHGKAGRPGAQADNSAFQQGLRRGRSELPCGARALVIESWTDVSKSLYAGDEISVRQHTMMRLALTNITKVLHEVADFVYLAGGTTALRHGTLQRLYRRRARRHATRHLIADGLADMRA